jgi:hypothetical protein
MFHFPEFNARNRTTISLSNGQWGVLMPNNLGPSKALLYRIPMTLSVNEETGLPSFTFELIVTTERVPAHTSNWCGKIASGKPKMSLQLAPPKRRFCRAP